MLDGVLSGLICWPGRLEAEVLEFSGGPVERLGCLWFTVRFRIVQGAEACVGVAVRLGAWC